MSDKPEGWSAEYPKSYDSMGFSKRPNFYRCAGSVYPVAPWGVQQCSRKRGHGPDAAYCKQHDPVAKRAKSEAQNAQWRAEAEKAQAEQQHRNFEQAKGKHAHVLIDALLTIQYAKTNDPSSLATEAIAEFERLVGSAA